MGLDEKAVVEQLKEAGNKLLQPPTSNDELLNLTGDIAIILKTVEQCPSLKVQEAMLPTMKALISNSLIKNSDSDIKTMVAVCFNEITRITAPDAPYDDNRMKDVIELIVASFDNLSLLSGRSYDEAVSILHNVAKVKSCVMMLDLECEKLIMKMFKQFLGNLSSDHPPSVFSAMETIMTVIIDESEDVSLELLKVLLDSVRMGNEKASSMSWKLGAKVIANTAKKLKSYVRKALTSGQINKDDYGTLIDSIFHNGSEALEENHDDDSAENRVVKEPAASATSPGDAVQSGNDAIRTDKSANMSEDIKKIKPPMNSNSKSETEAEKEARSGSTKRGRKLNSPYYDRNNVSPNKLPASPRGRPRKITYACSPKILEVKSPAQKSVDSRKESEIHSGTEEKNVPIVSEELSQGTKKVGRPKRNASEGSGNNSVENSGKDNKVARRKRTRGDEVFETPCGRKTHEDIVGYRIKVWWSIDKVFYEGRVASYCPSTMKHRVDYDDGEVEVLRLAKEKFEFMVDADDVGSQQKGEAPREQLLSIS